MSHITTGRRGVGACLFAVVVALSLAGCGSSSPSDSALAYCLATGQQAKFVDAAVALEPSVVRGKAAGTIAGSKGDLTIAEWRRDNGLAFDRVCDAIHPADPPDDVTNALIALGNVTAGALLALLAASWTARVTRRRQVSDALRGSAGRFVRATDSLVTRRTGVVAQGLTESDVIDRMSVLESALLRASPLRRRSRPRVAAALQRLDEFTPKLFDAWPMNTAEEKAAHGKGLTDGARAVRQRVEAIATIFDHAWWQRQPPEQP